LTYWTDIAQTFNEDFDESRAKNPVAHSFSRRRFDVVGACKRLWWRINQQCKQMSIQKMVSIAGFSFIILSVLVITSGMFSSREDLDETSTATRPLALQNGIVTPSPFQGHQAGEEHGALIGFETAEVYKPVVLEGGEGVAVVPPELCVERKFTCEFYYASGTNNGHRPSKTPYCSVFVCKGMSVHISVRPESCSGQNKVGITKMEHDVYYTAPLAYACANTGCGECSQASLITTNTEPLAFTQACAGDVSCYGQIDVVVTKSTSPSLLLGKNTKLDMVSIPKQYLQASGSPKFRNGAGNKGQYGFSVSDFSINWQFKIFLGFRSSPVIDNKGTVYIGSDDSNVYAITGATGEVKWKFNTDGKVFSTPCLSADGTLYVGSDDRHVYAVTSHSGVRKWAFPTMGKVHASPVISFDGLVYIGSTDGIFYALKPTGALAWAFSVRNGATYNQKELLNYSNTLQQQSSETSITEGFAITSTAAVASKDNSILFGCENGYLYALSPEGLYCC
jgi:hypothetical protein